MIKLLKESFLILLLNLIVVNLCLVNLSHAAEIKKQTKKQVIHILTDPFPAPDFTLQGEDGKTYRLSDYRGKTVILNFWSTWCPPCRFEMPSMERAWQIIKDKGIIILAVNMGEDEDTIFKFFADYPVTFPIPMDIEGTVVKKYPVIGLPTTYIISPKGFVTHRAIGSREWEDEKLLKSLLSLYAP